MSEDFEYKVTTIKTSGYTRCGNVSTYWESKPKVIDMSQYIPIEWIKDYIIPFQVHHDSLSEELKENDGAGWVVDVLETMLKEWEKENETE